MVSLFKTWLNPFWWFDLVVVKPLALTIGAILWLPLVVAEWMYHKGMQAWDSKLVCYCKPKSLIGKCIVYPPLIWCAMPFTNTWLLGYIAVKYGVTWDDVWGITSGVWNIGMAFAAAGLDLIQFGWTALQHVL